jgi:pantetheine-phosphate adenylyltransferase
MANALYGGSFDPIHLGHLSVVERAAESFDAVFVVVLANPTKDTGMFSRSQRAELISASTHHLPNVSVHEYHGLIVDAAVDLGADVLLRSAHKEAQHEQSMAATNEMLTGMHTSFVMPEARSAWISSSMVRELTASGRLEVLETMVPEPVYAALTRTPTSPL